MIGIIGAMSEEVAQLKEIITIIKESEKYSFKFYEGLLHGKKVVLMQSGIGKVNAAVGTTILLEQFPIDYVINIGTAGGIKDDCEVLDIVISDRVCYHDVDVTAFSYYYGQIPKMPLYFESDTTLLNQTKDVLKELKFPYHIGLITSGDAFINNEDQVNNIKSKFKEAIACEMEATAISQVCHIYQKPFIVIRSLSDIAGKKSNISFDTYLEKSAKNSSLLVSKLIEKSSQ